MNRIIGTPSKGEELEIKRFYIPGAVIESECPKCNSPIEVDLGDEYLSYPVMGQPEEVSFYCDDCDHYWIVNVILELSIKLAEDND